ncbi:MAG: hypothetical protein R2728_00300 [Chitinophagales bacterium]
MKNPNSVSKLKLTIKKLLRKYLFLTLYKFIIARENKNKQHLHKPNLRDYNYLSKMLSEKDKKAVSRNPRLKRLHAELDNFRKEQINSWNSLFIVRDIITKATIKIGINGIKPNRAKNGKLLYL